MCLMSLLWDSGYFLKRYEDLDGNNLVELVNHMNGKRLCNLTNYKKVGRIKILLSSQETSSKNFFLTDNWK